MTNHLSTEKAVRKTIRKSRVNSDRKARIKTYIKKIIVAIETSSGGDLAVKALANLQSEMMRAVSKGLIKKNTASRKISRLAKKVKLASIEK